jgi:hypothetical protein
MEERMTMLLTELIGKSIEPLGVKTSTLPDSTLRLLTVAIPNPSIVANRRK